MMKMKKATITLTIFGAENKQYQGLKSTFFGIHKDDTDRFSITHLQTGFRVFSFKKLSHARLWVEMAETDAEMPVSWDTENPETLNDNASRANELLLSVNLQ